MIPIREENEVFYEYYLEGFRDDDYKECSALLTKEEALQVCEVLKANPDAKFCDLPKKLYEELTIIAMTDAVEHGFPGDSKEYGTRLCLQEDMPDDFIALLEKAKVTDVETPLPAVESNVDRKDMKILNLIIKQKYFDEIIEGTKTQEFREVKPTTIKKLLQLDDEGYEIEDENQNAIPIEYDAIQFYVGYNKDRDSALVEVKGARCEMFTEPVPYKADKDGNLLRFAVDEKGALITDGNGNFIESTDENAIPVAPREGDYYVEVDELISYEHDGKLWYAEQVVYDLGKVLECNKK